MTAEIVVRCRYSQVIIDNLSILYVYSFIPGLFFFFFYDEPRHNVCSLKLEVRSTEPQKCVLMYMYLYVKIINVVYDYDYQQTTKNKSIKFRIASRERRLTCR